MDVLNRVNVISGCIGAALLGIVVLSSPMLVEDVPAGKYVVKQGAISGELEVWDEPGWKSQMFGDIT